MPLLRLLYVVLADNACVQRQDRHPDSKRDGLPEVHGGWTGVREGRHGDRTGCARGDVHQEWVCSCFFTVRLASFCQWPHFPAGFTVRVVSLTVFFFRWPHFSVGLIAPFV